MESVGVRHRYSGCDGKNIVNMLLYTMDMMSPHIEDEISEIELVWYQYRGCGDRNNVDMM